MEQLLSHLPFHREVIAIFVVATFGLIGLLASKYFSRGSKTIDQEKLLLKQLLEGFGLEIPSELKELEPTVVKSIKSP
tara:strand:+ start:513 stop:746 length:234 start_codon:yes stop_codon:yes gene_type:complete